MNLTEQEPQPADPEYRTIPLTQGQSAIVDVDNKSGLKGVS